MTQNLENTIFFGRSWFDLSKFDCDSKCAQKLSRNSDFRHARAGGPQASENKLAWDFETISDTHQNEVEIWSCLTNWIDIFVPGLLVYGRPQSGNRKDSGACYGSCSRDLSRCIPEWGIWGSFHALPVLNHINRTSYWV